METSATASPTFSTPSLTPLKISTPEVSRPTTPAGRSRSSSVSSSSSQKIEDKIERVTSKERQTQRRAQKGEPCCTKTMRHM
jgi:hypothetical protein